MPPFAFPLALTPRVGAVLFAFLAFVAPVLAWASMPLPVFYGATRISPICFYQPLSGDKHSRAQIDAFGAALCQIATDRLTAHKTGLSVESLHPASSRFLDADRVTYTVLASEQMLNSKRYLVLGAMLSRSGTPSKLLCTARVAGFTGTISKDVVDAIDAQISSCV